MNGTRNNLAKLAAALAEDPAAESGVNGLIAHSAIVRILCQYRLEKGLSQADVARSMKCDPSKISRLENGYDDDLAWGDILSYLAAVDATITVLFHDCKAPIQERTKHLVFMIHDNLEQLADIARSMDGDDAAVEKINSFCGDVLLNFLVRFDTSYKKIQQVRPRALTEPARAALPATTQQAQPTC